MLGIAHTPSKLEDNGKETKSEPYDRNLGVLPSRRDRGRHVNHRNWRRRCAPVLTRLPRRLIHRVPPPSSGIHNGAPRSHTRTCLSPPHPFSQSSFSSRFATSFHTPPPLPLVSCRLFRAFSLSCNPRASVLPLGTRAFFPCTVLPPAERKKVLESYVQKSDCKMTNLPLR